MDHFDLHSRVINAFGNLTRSSRLPESVYNKIMAREEKVLSLIDMFGETDLERCKEAFVTALEEAQAMLDELTQEDYE